MNEKPDYIKIVLALLPKVHKIDGVDALGCDPVLDLSLKNNSKLFANFFSFTKFFLTRRDKCSYSG